MSTSSQMVMFFFGRKIGFSKCCWNVISSGLHVSSNLQRQWSISQGHLEFSEHIPYNPNSPRKTHNCYKGCLNKFVLESFNGALYKSTLPNTATCSLKTWARPVNPQKSFGFHVSKCPGLQARAWCKLQPYHWSFVSAATPPGTSRPFGIVTRGSGSCSWQIGEKSV